MKKIMILMVLLVGVLFLSSCSLKCDNPIGENGFCGDDIPTFLNAIDEFKLTGYNVTNWKEECGDFDEESICIVENRLEYLNDETNEEIHILPRYISKGDIESVNEFAKTNYLTLSEFVDIYVTGESWEFFWFTDVEFDQVITQTYGSTIEDGNIKYNPVTADVSNVVIQKFLADYPAK